MNPIRIPSGVSSGQARLRALGRLKPGEMNKTEAAYALRLQALKNSGEILWFEFEAVKLKLADNTHLTMDFAVMLANGQLEMHDVKGSAAIFQDDAKVKMKVAAAKFPFVFKAVYPIPKKDGGGWMVDEF